MWIKSEHSTDPEIMISGPKRDRGGQKSNVAKMEVVFRELFGDLRRYQSSAKHCRHRPPKVRVQQCLFENGAQLCS